MGMLQVGLGAGLAVGPMLGGALADAYGYASAFYVTSVMLALAGLVVLVWVHEESPTQGLWRALLQHLAPVAHATGSIDRLSTTLLEPIGAYDGRAGRAAFR